MITAVYSHRAVYPSLCVAVSNLSPWLFALTHNKVGECMARKSESYNIEIFPFFAFQQILSEIDTYFSSRKRSKATL